MHQKRSNISLKWPIPRKGSTYIAVASHSKNSSIPLVVILREMLNIARTKKEAKYITKNKYVKVNNKVRNNEKFPVQLYDIVSLEKSKKSYRLEIHNKKFTLKEVSGEDAKQLTLKVIGKKIISKDKIQANLLNGQNFLMKEGFSVGDSLLVDTEKNKILKIIKLTKGANVEIIVGKHAGQVGTLNEIVQTGNEKRYLVQLEGKEINLPFKSLLAIE
jgi:small subunit ribosomal protein S4e